MRPPAHSVNLDQPSLETTALVRPRGTPSNGASSRGQVRLPDDLLREASWRLGILSLLGAVLWIVAPVFAHVAAGVIKPSDPGWINFRALDIIAILSALSSLALYAFTRHHEADPQFVLNLGLWYMILVALALSLALHWGPIPAGTVVQPQISWAGAVMLMFAAIVPNQPRRVLVACLIAASMSPLSMMLAKARGTWEFGAWNQVFVMHYPDYLLAGVAVVISSVVMKLGHALTKAREMGSYRLEGLLGRGGMGEVYKATHRMLARPAAIKLIRPEMLAQADGDSAGLVLARFRREAQAAASLTSPHTVQVFDFGVTEDKTFYFVMELLDGMDLESLVRHFGPLPPARVVHILRQACESLEEAHARGLVHRDIKPENIHLGRKGLRHDFVKVLDFGIVKALGARSQAPTLATSDGLTPGTPAYMAPEVSLGGLVDHRVDIYALGCVAYYLLTAELVFRGDNAFQVMAKHLQAEPPRPSTRTNHDVPPALDDLVLACLAKEPAARPQSASLVAGALAALPIEPWTEEQAKDWWSEHDTTAKVNV